MSNHSTIYIDNDSLLVVESLKDRAGNLITTATVSLVSFVDKNGNAVDGVTVPSTLNHVGAGTYELLLPSAIAVVAGQTYYATVRAVQSSLQGTWTETVLAKRRVA